MEEDTLIAFVRSMKPKDHVVLFYEHVEDKYCLLSSCLKAGLDSQEAIAYVAGIDEAPGQIRDALKEFGVCVDELESKGMLRLISYKDWYISDGEFSIERTMNL